MRTFSCLPGGSTLAGALWLVSALAGMTIAAQAWTVKQAPLMTPWAAEVDPARPLPEYPRPQLVRADWLNLNGVWQYQPGAEGDARPAGKKLASEILVPFAVESALSGVMEHHDRLWYRRTFRVPPGWSGQQVLLHFEAVDYESEAFLNGKSLGVHKGGYDAFSYDVTALLAGAGEQELIVRVFDPTDMGGQPRGKQTTHPGGITYTPATGIWQTVWLEPVPAASISGLKIVPDVDQSVVRITVDVTNRALAGDVTVRVKEGETVVQSVDGIAGAELVLPLRAPKLWSPSSPFLYDLEVSLKAGDQTIDRVTSYFGLRKISLGEDKGVKKLFLNNKFLFEFGPLDQGFWPDSIYTPPTEAALRNEILQMKAMGFNMVRKHIKVEPARWYYWTDKLGLLVWQDMPAANAYRGKEAGPTPPLDTAEFKSELQRLVLGHLNNPSIILWVAFNEGSGQHDTEALVGMIKQLDPSRLVNEASGGPFKGAGDVYDIHHYPEPACPPPQPAKALACGEFGGIANKVPGHMWAGTGGGYIEASTPEQLLFRYADYASKVRRLRDEAGLSAVVYTQLTDVEKELNGLLTYDRVPKVDVAEIGAATRFALPDLTK